MTMRKPLFAAALTALLATGAAAASPMDLTIIDRAVADFTGAEVGQPGGAKLPVDRRLRLANCESPLDMQWFGRDQRSVQVVCPGAGWRIYVAVDAGFSNANRMPQQFGEAIIIVRRASSTHECPLMLGVLMVQVHVSSPAVAGMLVHGRE